MRKVVLITGGSSGIGKAIGDYLVQNGFIVYGTSRYPEKYTDSKFPILKLDVKNMEAIKLAVHEIIEREGRVDVVVNNAGAGITGPIEEIPEAEIKANFETNFFGPINVIKAVLPQMRKQHSGLIINITSIAGYMGLPYRGVYSASKGALELITEAFRMELKDFNIKMTNIAPRDFASDIASERYRAHSKVDAAYKAPCCDTLELINAHVYGRSKPQLIAEAVLKVIQTKQPKIHYKVGVFMQKFSSVVKRVL